MGSALKAEPFLPTVSQPSTVNPTHRAAIRAADSYELSDDELEALEFRCQGLQARVDLDAMRIEALLRDCQQPALTDIQ